MIENGSCSITVEATETVSNHELYTLGITEKLDIAVKTETGAKYQLQFSIMNDRVQLYLDTSGPGLHKRGYRANANEAPLRETLAAAMVMLTR